MSQKYIGAGVFLLLSAVLSLPAPAQDLTIAAAADLRSTLDEIAAVFRLTPAHA
jgi:hypothetical protein